MKDLHEEELRVQVNEIYRKMCLSPPDMSKRPLERAPDRRRSAERRRPDRHARPRAPEPDYKRDRRRLARHCFQIQSNIFSLSLTLLALH